LDKVLTLFYFGDVNIKLYKSVGQVCDKVILDCAAELVEVIGLAQTAAGKQVAAPCDKLGWRLLTHKFLANLHGADVGVTGAFGIIDFHVEIELAFEQELQTLDVQHFVLERVEEVDVDVEVVHVHHGPEQKQPEDLVVKVFLNQNVYQR